jgi:hypothetical protein
VSWVVLALLELVVLKTVDNREVAINPKYVISLSVPKSGGTLSSSVNCVVTFTDGKFLSMKESCAEVRKQLGLENP